MLSALLGARIAGRAWRSPVGVALGLFLVASPPLLLLLSPRGHVTHAHSPLLSLAPLGVVVGSSLALAFLSKRASFLELLPVSSRLVTEMAALMTSPLLAIAWLAVGARELGSLPSTIPLTLVASTQLSGAGLILLHLRLPTMGRIGGFLAAVWMGPALLLEPAGWQGWIGRALDAGSAFKLVGSDSPATTAILPLAFLAVAVALGGGLLARALIRNG